MIYDNNPHQHIHTSLSKQSFVSIHHKNTINNAQTATFSLPFFLMFNTTIHKATSSHSLTTSLPLPLSPSFSPSLSLSISTTTISYFLFSFSTPIPTTKSKPTTIIPVPAHCVKLITSSNKKYDPIAVPITRHGRNADTTGLGRYRMPMELRGKQRAVLTKEAQKRGRAMADHCVVRRREG